MTRDEAISLAEQIARDLRGLRRNDWQRWVQLTGSQPIERGLSWADQLGKDLTLRPNIQRANTQIAQKMASHLPRLKALTMQDRNVVFGYVGWMLRIDEHSENSSRPFTRR